jgi:arginine exporter protein ArgO
MAGPESRPSWSSGFKETAKNVFIGGAIIAAALYFIGLLAG